MLCIGKLVKFDTGYKEGRIEQIYPEKKDSFRFGINELETNGTMKRRAPRVKTPAYVIYEWNEGTGRPGNIMLIRDYQDRRGLIERIRESGLDAEVMEPVIRACLTDGIEVPEDLEDVRAVYEWLDGVKNAGLAFDFDEWKIIPDIYKALMIFQYAHEREIIKNAWDVIGKEIMPYEEKGNKIIFSMLFFMRSAYVKKERKDVLLIRGNKELLDAIGEAYDQKMGIEDLLHVILPACISDNRDSYDAYCDAYIYQSTNQKTNQKIRYITCQYNTAQYIDGVKEYRCNCLNCDAEQDIEKSITKRHLEQVKRRESLPDIRDLLWKIRFDITYILPRLKEDQGKIDTATYPYQIAAYVLRLDQAFPYLRCRHCHKILYPDFSERSYSLRYSLTNFRCPDAKSKNEDLHDDLVYINHCFSCRSIRDERTIIDSRECGVTGKEVDPEKNENMLLCMRCGGTKGGKDGIEPGKYCPSASCKKELLPQDKEFFEQKGYVKCSRCGHDGSLFGIRPNPDAWDPDHNRKQRERRANRFAVRQ